MNFPLRNNFRFPVPAPAALCLGVLAGTVPAVVFGAFLPWGGAVAVAVIVSAFFLLKKPFAIVASVGVALGVAAVLLHALWDARPGAYENRLPPRSCGAVAELRVADPRISSVPGIDPPTLIRAEVRRIRLSGEMEFHRASGIVYLKLPTENPPAVRCGDLLTAEGTFVLPEAAGLFTHGTGRRIAPMRDFSDYLAGRGATRTFRAREADVTGRSIGVAGTLAGLRDVLLERTVEHIDSARIRNLTAALFFGTSGGIDAENRQVLIESGTIHLFSVSGIHVALLAAVLLWMLRPLPFRCRYLMLASLVFLYVLSTGANAPAMRAFYMIGLWCVLRASLYYMPSSHALMLAGAVLILVSPDLILDMGFQYSFLITAILILSGERFDRAAELLGEEFCYMPNSLCRRRREQHLRRGWALLFAVGACVAAFLGGVGISLYSQGLLLPGSIVANLVLMPVVALLFPVLMFKLGFGMFWEGFDRAGAWMLEQCFWLMDAVVRISATGFGRLPAVRPSVLEVLVFYAALFTLIAVRSRRAVWLAGAVLLLLPASWMIRADLHSPALFVTAGSDDEPAVVVFHDPASGYACAVNASGYATVPAAVDFLQTRGVTRLDRLAFTAARSGNLAGITQLSTRIPVSGVMVSELDRYSRTFVAKLEKALPGCRIATVSGGDAYGPLEIISQKSGFELVYSNRCVNFEWRLVLEQTDSGCHLMLHQPGRESVEALLPNSSVPEVWIYEFR